MRYSILAVLAAAVLAPIATAAQVAPSGDPRGLRELRAHYLPPPFAGAWVAATDDGLVELAFDARSAGRPDPLSPPSGLREFYEPSEVLEWISGVGALLHWMTEGEAESVPPTQVLGRKGGSLFELRGKVSEGRRMATFVFTRCRLGPRQFDVDRHAIAATVAEFRRAALEARSVRPQRAPDDAIWYEHAVGCPANAPTGLAVVEWPGDAPAALGPREELVQFVVSASGTVESGSERFLPSSDPRFQAAIRRTLRRWRFQPATRGARPVRQLLHFNIAFTPPVVYAPGQRCPIHQDGSPTTCDELFTLRTMFGVMTVLPQGDGGVRIANGYVPSGRSLSHPETHVRFVLPAAQLRRFVDSVAVLLQIIETDSTRPSLPDQEYAANAPMIGTPTGLGLNMWLSTTGWIRAGFNCGRPGQGQIYFFQAGPHHFTDFRRAVQAAVDRVRLQPRLAPRGGRPFVTHELSCEVVPQPPVQQATLPRSTAQVRSREVLARFVVDTFGLVEPRSIDFMAGIDSMSRRVVAEALGGWRFQPAAAGLSLVRVQRYVSVVLRPPDADAVLLADGPDSASQTRVASRTIFFRSGPEPGPPPLNTTTEAWPRAIAAMQPYVDRARGTWPSPRARFGALPLGHRLFVTARLTDILGRMEHVTIQVDSVRAPVIHGRIRSEVGSVIGWRRGDMFSLDETELIDWMIVGPTGPVEGDVVGRWFRARPPTLPVLPALPPSSPPASRRQAESGAGPTIRPVWRDSVRYGGGPSVGAPLSDYTGQSPPARWCLEATRGAPGDFGNSGQSWISISRSWLRQVLSDTTSHGDGWRKVLGGAPRLEASDSIVQVFDEAECREIAGILNRDLLGWRVGPPPVVVLRVRDYLIAFPSNARMGEFGMAVGMDSRRVIRGVAAW